VQVDFDKAPDPSGRKEVLFGSSGRGRQDAVDFPSERERRSNGRVLTNARADSIEAL